MSIEDEGAEAAPPSPFVAGVQDLAAAVALGAFACSIIFDAQSQRPGDQFIFARGGYQLVCIGLLAGIVAAVFGAAALSSVDRGSVAFRHGVRRLIAGDAVLVWFALAWLMRHDSPPWPTPPWVLGLSGFAVLALAWLRWLARSGAAFGAERPPS